MLASFSCRIYAETQGRKVLDHPTLRRALTLRQLIVACTLLVPANIRATTRRYRKVCRTQITLRHAIGRQLCYPSSSNPRLNLHFLFGTIFFNKETYARDIDVYLNAVNVPVDAICCKDTECSNEQHFEALNVFYEGIVGVLTEASKKLSKRRRKHRPRSRPIATSQAGTIM